ALRRAKEEAETANHAKDHFLAVLSHELRTPLTPILTAVHLLELRQDLPAYAVAQLEVVRRNAELEARLIDDLLDITG
ncbi:sensor histidine kinase, partial [Raoultella planticola]